MTAMDTESPVTASVPRPPAGVTTPPRPRRGVNRSAVTAAVSVVGGLALWEVLGRWVVNPLFFPPPSSVWTRFLELVREGQLGNDIATSARSYLPGLLLAILIGGALGVAMAGSRVVRDIANPWVAVLNATPTIALAPLFILIFGLGVESKVAVCTLVMVFPILVNTYAGFSNCDEALVETAHSYGATRRQVYTRVRLPMALPTLIAGLRLSAAHGLVGVVVSELFGAKAGVGLLILNSAQTFDSRALFVGIVLLAIAGIGITYALIFVENHLARWRKGAEQ